MKTTKLLTPFVASLLLLGLTTSLHAALPTGGTGWTLTETATGWTLVDTVELRTGTDRTTGWSTVTNGTFATSTTNGLAPVTGSKFFATNNTAVNGTERYYSGLTFAEGTYTIRFSVGASATNFTTPAVYLMADANHDGTYSYGDRVRVPDTTPATNSAPAAGTWKPWSFNFEVTADTKNNQSPPISVVGSQLGFMIYVGSVSANSGFAFDNLTITYKSNAPVVPEPATTVLLGGLSILLLAAGIRYTRRS